MYGETQFQFMQSSFLDGKVCFVKAKEIPILLLKAGWYIGNSTEVISQIKCLKRVFLD